jgi:phosphorylase kinase alpha/beta subunit
MSKGLFVFRDHNDLRVVRKLIDYLNAIEYWQDRDNGMWEEAEELHASSIGACLAGLKSMAKYVHVPKHMIENGRKALDELLPAESETKDVDMSLLSLIYPYKIVTEKQASLILRNVEKELVRNKGVIRYHGDQYYHNGKGEAEWVMGFPWLALIHKQLGNTGKYRQYMRKAKGSMCIKGFAPELYLSGTKIHNENNPLGWSQSLYLAAAANA